MRSRFIPFGLISAALLFVLAIPAARAGGPELEKELQRVRQALADIESSLSKQTVAGDARLDARLQELESSLSLLRSHTGTSGSALGARLDQVERQVTELRQKLGNLDGKVGSSAAMQREFKALRAELARLTNELARRPAPSAVPTRSQPPAQQMYCEFRKQRWDNISTYNMGKVAYTDESVSGPLETVLLDALKSACRKCGPREYRDAYTAKHYDITNCSLVGCYWTANGALVNTHEALLRLTPPECRKAPVVAQKPVRRIYCSMNFFDGSHGAPRYEGESATLEAIGENVFAAVQAACGACRAHAAKRLRETYLPAMSYYGCNNLSCVNTDDKTAAYIPPNAVPQGCAFTGGRPH